MPSGAKKRKAAMKKRNNQAKNISATTSNADLDLNRIMVGNGVLKSPEIDGVEENSSVSTGALLVLSNVATNIYNEEKDAPNGDVQITKELNVDNVDSVNKSIYNRSSSSSSSSNSNSSNQSNTCYSNDESQTVEKSSVYEGDSSIEENTCISDYFAVETEPIVDSIPLAKTDIIETSENPVIEWKMIEGKVLPLSCGLEIKETGDNKLLKSSDASVLETKHINGSEIHECSENQPLLDPASRQVKKTSWMSCCGLFDVFPSSKK